MSSPAALKRLAAVVVLGLAAAPFAAQAADVENGRKLAYTCHGCHGIPDYKNAYPSYSVPKIGGQSAAYMTAALQAYRSGERYHPTMKGQAGGLTDKDYADLAAYFEGRKVQPTGKPAPAGAPAAAQVCVACHGTDGVGLAPEYPTLTGQYADYLERALNDYRTGKRKNVIMAGFAQQLTREDIKALAKYYASQGPGLYVPGKKDR